MPIHTDTEVLNLKEKLIKGLKSRIKVCFEWTGRTSIDQESTKEELSYLYESYEALDKAHPEKYLYSVEEIEENISNTSDLIALGEVQESFQPILDAINTYANECNRLFLSKNKLPSVISSEYLNRACREFVINNKHKLIFIAPDLWLSHK